MYLVSHNPSDMLFPCKSLYLVRAMMYIQLPENYFHYLDKQIQHSKPVHENVHKQL